MTKVTTKLNLNEAIGVSSSESLEKIMVDRGLIAGIEFHDSSVRLLIFKSINNIIINILINSSFCHYQFYALL